MESESDVFTVEVDNQSYVVRVTEGSKKLEKNFQKKITDDGKQESTLRVSKMVAPLAGNVFTINVKVGQIINEGDTVLVLEAMKMETDIRASEAGIVSEIKVETGDAVKVGDVLLTLT